MIRNRSAAGLSIAMLLFWTIADVLGLIGLILSDEHGTLLWLTVFFTFNNLFASSLWFFYDKIYPRYFQNEPHDGYTSLNDDDNGDNDDGLSKALLSGNGSDDDNDGHAMVLKSRKRGAAAVGNKEEKSFLDTSNSDLLDAPIISIENSINASGGNGSYSPNHNGEHIMTTRSGSGQRHFGMLSPTTFSLVVCIVAVSSLQLVDAQIVKDVINNVSQQVYQLVTNNPENLPKCHPVADLTVIRRIIGFTLTAICAVMNSVSRIPQVLLNNKRKTTAGLSLSFIILQFTANVFFFISRFTPTTLVFDMHWLETSLPWVISTAFSTVCLVTIWWQVYWFGNGASILPRKHFKYARGLLDPLFFCLPRRKADQPDDGYDIFFNAIANFENDPETFFRVASTLQAKRMDYDTIDALDNQNKDDIVLDDIDADFDQDEESDQFFTEADVNAVQKSNFHNPIFGITADYEGDNLLHTAVVQSSSFLRTGSFNKTPSSMMLLGNKSTLGRGDSFIRTSSNFGRTKSNFGKPNQSGFHKKVVFDDLP
jgi:hypothetical protein